MSETVQVVNILTSNRIREDLGEMKVLADSIKEFGLIEPIVLAKVDGHVELTAGGRRLTAMKQLGITDLEHGRHFIWLDESNNDPYRRKAVELEENLRRKDLSWQEQVLGKQQLLKLMQSIHGPSTVGRGATGFGVRKLAAMLGEVPGGTSKDLAVADMIQAIPQLANEQSKAAAERKFGILKALLKITSTGKSIDEALATTAPKEQYAIMIQCKDEQEQLVLLERFTKEGLTCRALVS